MKSIGNKISYNQTARKLLINISGKGTKQQVQLLSTWLVLWTIGGIIVITQLFMDYPREQKMYMAIWLAFWFYFEWRVYYTLRWRRHGVEIIKVEGDKLTYSREVNGLGPIKPYETNQVRNLQVDDYSDKPFQKTFYNAFWSLGGEALLFYYQGKEVRFGMQLEVADARQLKKLIDKALEQAADTESENNG